MASALIETLAALEGHLMEIQARAGRWERFCHALAERYDRFRTLAGVFTRASEAFGADRRDAFAGAGLSARAFELAKSDGLLAGAAT